MNGMLIRVAEQTWKVRVSLGSGAARAQLPYPPVSEDPSLGHLFRISSTRRGAELGAIVWLGNE